MPGMNVLLSAARTDNLGSDDATAGIQELMVAAAAIEMATNPVLILSEKNLVPTGLVGPNGAPAQLPAATDSDENNEAASARIFSTTMLTALACHTKKSRAQSALALAPTEIGDLGPPVQLHAAMHFERANAATPVMPDKNWTLNLATCSLAAIRFHGLSGPAARLLASWAPGLALTLGLATTKLMSSRPKPVMLVMVTTPSGPLGTSARKHVWAAPSPASENTPAASAMLVALHTSSQRHKPAARKASGPNIPNTQPAHRLAKADL